MILEKTTGRYVLHKMACKEKIPKTLSGRKCNPKVPQKLLDHKSSKTAEIYTHVSKTIFTKIKKDRWTILWRN